MNDFQWKKSHVEWFLHTFGGRIPEISARDVSKRYYKNKRDEQSLNAQDFRNLMRLTVISRLARVTSGFCKNKEYKIRMTSGNHPYIQEIFDEEIFDTPFMVNPMPPPRDLQDYYLENLEITWDSFTNDIWSLTFNEGRRYLLSFYAHDYLGGDFDIVFERFPFPSEMNNNETKGFFILSSLIYVNIYKAYRLGRSELLEDSKINSRHEVPEDHNSFFISTFRSDMIKRFLFVLERPSVRISDRTLYNNFREVLRHYERGERIPEEFTKPLKRGRHYSEDTLYRADVEYGKNWRNILARSENVELKTALKNVENAYRELENFRVRCLRSNSSKKGT